MALNRKPRIGETIIYQEPNGDPVEIIVKGYRGHESTIMLAKFPNRGEADDIIWSFSDGTTNPYLRHSAPRPKGPIWLQPATLA